MNYVTYFDKLRERNLHPSRALTASAAIANGPATTWPSTNRTTKYSRIPEQKKRETVTPSKRAAMLKTGR
jgi:hypothetical protein